MPNLRTNVQLNYQGRVLNKAYNRTYSESNVIKKTLPTGDSMLPILKFNETAFGENTLKEAKALTFCNEGSASIELSMSIAQWTPGTPDENATSVPKIVTILHPGESLPLPHGRFVNYGTAVTSACRGDGGALNNTLLSAINSGNMFKDITTVAADFDNTTDPVTFSVADGDFLEIGDMIRTNSEVCEITAISGNDVTVRRAMQGTTAASHADSETVRLQFSNGHHEFEKALKGSSQLGITDGKGRWKSSNFFGLARTAGADNLGVAGLVPGSVAFTFYDKAYQEVQFANFIQGGDTSSLSASTAYAFDITVGDSAATTVSFTTGTNVNFSGSGSVVSKIDEALKTASLTSGNALEGWRATCSLVGGRLRFTDETNMHAHDGTNGSKILLATASSGTNLFSDSAGIFPATAALLKAHKPVLPLDEITDDKTGLTRTNDAAFMIDDGYGNLIYPAGSGSVVGQVHYVTGAVNFTIPGKPFSEFAINGNYDSAFSGRVISSSNAGNHIEIVYGRSINPKVNATIGIYAFR